MLTISRLSLDDALILIEAATAKSDEIGIPMCIAVVDESGNLVAFHKMDGGKPTSVSIAIDKAFTAAGARNPTAFYGKGSQPGGPAWGIDKTNNGRFCVIGGGVPVTQDGVVVGGIGISSGTSAQDVEVAEAAVKDFHQRTGVAA